MNPMQGPWNTGGSSSGMNQADGEFIYSAETYNMLNPVENEFPNNSMPSGRPTYGSSSSHAVQNYNCWRFGESSSISGTSDQVSSIGMKTNNHLPQDVAPHFAGYGSEGMQLGFSDIMANGGVHGGSHISNGPSFLRGSSSNTMPQHAHMSMDMDMDGNGCGGQTSFRQSTCGTSLGSSVQAAGESSNGPGSSFGGWVPSCKRKALEGPYPGETPDRVFQTENVASHVGLARYGASSSLSLATPSQTPNVTSHFNQTEQMFGSGGGRAVSANVFHSTRNTETVSRLGRRLNARQPQESVAFSISHTGSSVRPTGSLQHNLPLNSPFVDPQDARSILNTSGSRTGENQMNIVHLPALTRNIHQFAWDSSFNSRSSNSSGIGMPAEQFEPQWEAQRSNQEQPMFSPATYMRNPVHDQSVWSFTRGNPGSSVDSPFVPRAGPSSAFHAQQPNPTLIPPQSSPLHNSSRTSDLFSWSLFPSVESQSASRGASPSELPTGPSVTSNEVAMPPSSNRPSHRPRERRSGLLSERQNDLPQLRNSQRSLAADVYGRDRILSEISHALNAVRRGDTLWAEDYMALDQFLYQGMSEVQDRHQEMRLDIDNMSYEELVALTERVGYENTGLREEVILKTMKQHKLTSSSPELHQDIQPCCICQEEYAEGDDLGTLECGHQFHKDCIKQWVMLKNRCPICQTQALTT